MKNLGNLKPNKGANQRKKRLGRGIGSGLGKTAGKGHKGQKARKSANIRAGFEGGQTPLYRRSPKRGFKNFFRKRFEIVNLSSIEKHYKAGSEVDAVSLYKNGLISDVNSSLKILGKGSLSVTIKSVKAHKVSTSAKAAIEKCGGQIIYLPLKDSSDISKKINAARQKNKT